MGTYQVPGGGKATGKPEDIAKKYNVPVESLKPTTPSSAPATQHAGFGQVTTGGGGTTEPTPTTQQKSAGGATALAQPAPSTTDRTAFNQYINKLAAENPFVRGLVNVARSGVKITPIVPITASELQQRTGISTYQKQLDIWRQEVINAPTGAYWQVPLDKEGTGAGGYRTLRTKKEALGYIGEQEKQALKQQEDFNKQISGYPAGTTFKQTPRGYDVILPVEDRYAKMNKEFDKINQAYKINPVLGFVAELGYGAVSSGEALLAGGQNLLSKTGLVEPNLNYYPSFLDIAFEPKGADVWGKHPVFTSGAVFGETLQLWGGGKVIGAGMKAGGKVIKWGGAKLFASPLLKGTIVTEKVALAGGGRIAATQTAGKLSRFIPNVLKESETIQNFEKWAVKGYKPGKSLVEVPIKTGVKGEFNIQQLVYKADKSVGRIWLSPSEQLAYQARLASQGVLKIGFPTAKQLGRYSGRLSMAGERETFQAGLRGGLKGRTAMTFFKEDVLGTELGTAKGGSQAYKITDLIQPIKEVGIPKEIEINPFLRGSQPSSPFRSWIEEGFVKEKPIISLTRKLPGIEEETRTLGTRLTGYAGFGKQTAPLSEKAIWGLRKPGLLSKEALGNFARDIRALQSEIIQITKPSSILSKGGRLSGVSMNVPSDILGEGISRGATVGILGTAKGELGLSVSGEIKKMRQEPMVKIKQASQTRNVGFLPKSGLKVVSGLEQNVFNINLLKTEQISIQKQTQIQMQMQEQKLESMLKQETMQLQKSKTANQNIYETTTTGFPPPIILPKASAYGRGKAGSEFSLFEEKYRFRGRAIYDPMKELAKMKVKIKI